MKMYNMYIETLFFVWTIKIKTIWEWWLIIFWDQFYKCKQLNKCQQDNKFWQTLKIVNKPWNSTNVDIYQQMLAT